ncbi:MAG TPA: DUF5682 family protein [Gemmatimonadaceae bacterium]|nr:DUF5682 family protein [Gemmatimonadaceae bacterium]
MSVHLFGVRHHGPGSARSLRAALDALLPDIVLVEGPSDADAVLPLAVHAEMRPPVALLAYAPEEPRRAAYWPFAAFSPEWIAVRHALGRGVPVRFMDLPAAHQLALDASEDDATGRSDDAPPDAPGDGGAAAPTTSLRRDPLQRIAEAAGYADGERWWEHLVEERRDHAGVFDAVLEVMTAAREAHPDADDSEAARHDLLREAWMRQAIRRAEKEGFARIAVVCGAWHAPALAARGPAKLDAAALKGLPKLAVQATWIPWTSARLARASGYGAGVASPGWYAHLWEHGASSAGIIRWVARVARLLRDEGLDASPAQVVDAVRLAETLAALRGRPVAGLGEVTDAVVAAFLGGDATPLALVRDRLVVGDDLGAVPEDAPVMPLQRDLAREQKRLRLAPAAADRQLELDLRAPLDRERSLLLHRLRLLGIAWGEPRAASGKGTFKELWRLQWRPELALAVIEAAPWGNTVADAAAARAIHLASGADDLPALATLLASLLLADLPAATAAAVERLDALAAVAADVVQLCDALPPLARTLRYGDVRGTDRALVGHVVAGIVARTTAGLPAACGALADDAAEAMFARIVAADQAVTTLDDTALRGLWHEALGRVLDLPGVHGLVAGRCARLLLDAGALSADAMARRWAAALSPGAEPAAAAAWVDGVLRGGGTLLLHDPVLFPLLDRWLTGLHGDAFVTALPLLRRTAATFEAPERRRLAERAAHGVERGRGAVDAAGVPFDETRAAAALAVVAAALGLDTSPATETAHD